MFIMNIFRQIAIGTEVKHRLAITRHPLLAVPSLIKKHGEFVIIQMALQIKRKTWVQKI